MLGAMKALLAAALVLALGAAACSAGGNDGKGEAAGTGGIVARIADGDSLELESGERVRLLQVDSPELGEGECYGREAKETLERLMPPGTRVGLETDPGLDEIDGFGRLLRYVIVGGENANVELVRAGSAAPYFFEGNEGAYALELIDAVKDAKDEGAGMWGACQVDWSQGRQVDTFPR